MFTPELRRNRRPTDDEERAIQRICRSCAVRTDCGVDALNQIESGIAVAGWRDGVWCGNGEIPDRHAVVLLRLAVYRGVTPRRLAAC